MLKIKVILCLSTIIISICLFHNTSYCCASAENEVFYAQIQSPNVYLYSSNLIPIFEIPETYYVRLLENSKNGYYTAEYMGVQGIINENEIQCVSNTPTTPYLRNVSFRNYGAQSSEIRTEPSRLGGTTTLICELPLYETNFEFIGKISGEEVVPNRGDIWYYCTYTKNNQTRTGYIYAGLIDMLSTYYSNPIDSFPILKHNWKVENANITPAITLPSSNQTIVIIIISLALFILLLALFKPATKRKTTIQHRETNAILNEPRYTNYNLQNMGNTKVYSICDYAKPTRKINKHKRNKDYYEL